MAGGKLPPRQKMIGMMYLVLTALLAMNVSKDILEAFVVINKGIEKTNSNFESKNQSTYHAFDRAKSNDPQKVTSFWQKAQQAKKFADALDTHIDNLKRHIIRTTDKIPEENWEVDSVYDLHNVNSKDNYDVPTYILIGDEPANPRNGEWSALELKEMVNNFREDLLRLIEDPIAREEMNIGLRTDEMKISATHTEPWEMAQFYHIPCAAVVTALTKIQSDVRNAEADVIKQLYGNISADDFKFDTLAAKVIPNTKYVFLGDTYRADVVIAAISTTQDPILIAGEDLDSNGMPTMIDSSRLSANRGTARYTFKPTSEGEVEWGGVLKVKKPDGSFQPYTFRDKFMVAKPAVVVSPTAMNVFYRGLDNPVSVSVSGIAGEKLQVNSTNGSMRAKNKAHGEYTINPGNAKECIVRVSADIKGEKKSFGQGIKFRVKDVPPPTPYFAGSKGGKVQKKKVFAAQGVIAKLENFQFEGVKYTVKQFKLGMNYKGSYVEKQGRGNRLTPDMKKLLKKAKKGTKIFISDIQAKGPAKTVPLGSLILTVI